MRPEASMSLGFLKNIAGSVASSLNTTYRGAASVAHPLNHGLARLRFPMYAAYQYAKTTWGLHTPYEAELSDLDDFAWQILRVHSGIRCLYQA